MSNIIERIESKKLYTTEEVAMLVIIILSMVGAFMILRGW